MTTLIHVSNGCAGDHAVRRSGGLLRAFNRMVRHRAVYHELMRLDDRLLADIGLTRADIAAVAHSAAADAAPAGMKLRTHLADLVRRVVSGIRTWLRRRAARAELMALDDRLLADIGLTRADIPAVLGSTSYGPSLKDEIDSLVRPFRLWQRSRQAARTLHTLEDRALADAGMLRAEVGCVALELAERSLTPANNNGCKQVA